MPKVDASIVPVMEELTGYKTHGKWEVMFIILTLTLTAFYLVLWPND